MDNCIGKIKILGDETDSEPDVVYVRKRNSFGHLVCEVVNTGATRFAGPEDLTEFDYKKYLTMLYKYRINNTERIKANRIKLLKELED